MHRVAILAVLVSGCVTSGQVHDARVAQVSCLDKLIQYEQLALVLTRTRNQLAGYEDECVRGLLRADCGALAADRRKTENDLAMTNAQAAEQHRACVALGSRADDLADQHDRQAAAAQGFAAGMQAAAPSPPVRCTSTANGNQVYTTCN